MLIAGKSDILLRTGRQGFHVLADRAEFTVPLDVAAAAQGKTFQLPFARAALDDLRKACFIRQVGPQDRYL